MLTGAGTLSPAPARYSRAPAHYHSRRHIITAIRPLPARAVNPWTGFLVDHEVYACSHVSQGPLPHVPRELSMDSFVAAQPKPPVPTTGSPLLDRLWQAAQQRGDSRPTADGLVQWARRFILFHNKRHPSELGRREAVHFLEHVVKTVPEPLPALAQARSALALLYG